MNNENTMTLLECSHVAKSYMLGRTAVPVLQDINMKIERGSWNAILGASGSGKTTLLNLLGTLEKPTSGDILFNGKSYASMSRRESSLFRAEKIGFVFQSYQLLPELTVLENVLLPSMAGVAGSRVPNASERARKLLEKVGLADRTEHLPAELSGGEQQRVALARALMCEPEIIFADEPTGNLDALTGSDILDLLMGFGGKPFALVMVTHSAEAAARCDRTLRLEKGRIVSGRQG